jgi:molybdenum cofactor biosynthesis enzyme MoaA
MVNNDGGISFCCYHYPFANISNVSENAIAEIWNGEVAQDLRKRWNEGQLKGTPCSNCVGLKMFKQFGYPVENISAMSGDTFANVQLNINEFHEGKTVLKSLPVEIDYNPSVLCNIHCIHCFQPPIGKSNNTYIESKDLLKFYHCLGSRAVRNIFSGGEPLYLRQTYQLIAEFSPEHKAASEAIFFTNGILIKDKFQSIAGFRKYGFRISIASIIKDIYEYIHRGSSFEKLVENLEFLVQCKSEGMDISLTRVLVLMKSNFGDLDSIFDFAKTYRFDAIEVLPIHPAFEKGKILYNENVFSLPWLLEKIPSWPDILARASQNAAMADNKITYYNLEYIRNQLSSSVVTNRLRSLRNLFGWWLRATILKLLSASSSADRKRLTAMWYHRVQAVFRR